MLCSARHCQKGFHLFVRPSFCMYDRNPNPKRLSGRDAARVQGRGGTVRLQGSAHHQCHLPMVSPRPSEKGTSSKNLLESHGRNLAWTALGVPYSLNIYSEAFPSPSPGTHPGCRPKLPGLYRKTTPEGNSRLVQNSGVPRSLKTAPPLGPP